jgi:hypothetical protein
MFYITLGGGCCDIIVLNVHSPTEDKSDDTKDSFYEEMERVLDQFPKHDIKILLDFNAKVGTKDTFNLTIGNENLYEINNDNTIRIANFATSKNLTAKS